jgi:cAMP-dependent protein kinase regulator
LLLADIQSCFNKKMGLCSSSSTTTTTEDDEARRRQSGMSEESAAAMRKKVRKKGRRISVTAESGHDDTADFVPPNITKTEEERDHIKSILGNVFLFQGMTTDEVSTLIGAMSPVTVAQGESIIKQGDAGDFFYIVDSGEFDVFVNGVVDEQQAPKSVFHYKTGGSFGELALMYNAPRAATVTASSNSILWSVDRKTFRKIVIQSRQKRSRYYEQFLKAVPLFEKLTDAERSQLADALAPVEFAEGVVILNQGDQDLDNNKFYLVSEGTATVTIERDGKTAVVGTVKTNGYFGEKALIDKTPRAATVMAGAGGMKCAMMDVSTFERLMGREYF